MHASFENTVISQLTVHISIGKHSARNVYHPVKDKSLLFFIVCQHIKVARRSKLMLPASQLQVVTQGLTGQNS
jgi:hypothetical protein